MEFLYSFPVILLLVVVIFGFKAFIVVPQQEVYVVERLGRFHNALTAGLNILIPFVDRVAYRLPRFQTTFPESKPFEYYLRYGYDEACPYTFTLIMKGIPHDHLVYCRCRRPDCRAVCRYCISLGCQRGFVRRGIGVLADR